MAAKNKKCLACSTKYSYCPSCSKADALKPSYFSEFCSTECMTLWTTCTRYNLNKLTKPEAKAIISALPLKPVEQYANCVQRDLGVILAEEPKPKAKRSKRAALPVIDEAIPEEVKPAVNEIIEEIIDNQSVVTTEPVTDQDVHKVVNETNENE